jgi:hypothetical protein
MFFSLNNYSEAFYLKGATVLAACFSVERVGALGSEEIQKLQSESR